MYDTCVRKIIIKLSILVPAAAGYANLITVRACIGVSSIIISLHAVLSYLVLKFKGPSTVLTFLTLNFSVGKVVFKKYKPTLAFAR